MKLEQRNAVSAADHVAMTTGDDAADDISDTESTSSDRRKYRCTHAAVVPVTLCARQYESISCRTVIIWGQLSLLSSAGQAMSSS